LSACVVMANSSRPTTRRIRCGPTSMVHGQAGNASSSRSTAPLASSHVHTWW
jgi:hypothetical protein